MYIPLGSPSFGVKRSALTPPIVAVAEARLSIAVTVSRPRTVSLDSIGRSA